MEGRRKPGVGGRRTRAKMVPQRENRKTGKRRGETERGMARGGGIGGSSRQSDKRGDRYCGVCPRICCNRLGLDASRKL
eukprot:13944018-Alexandrium_andersonii.AAC.1